MPQGCLCPKLLLMIIASTCWYAIFDLCSVTHCNLLVSMLCCIGLYEPEIRGPEVIYATLGMLCDGQLSVLCHKGVCKAGIAVYHLYTKRKPPCIGGMELVSLSCNRVFISAESVGRGWCKIAIATKWYQFHTTDKCGFLFMPWITDQLYICAIHKTSK